MRRQGLIEHQVLQGSIKLAGLRSCAREMAAEAASQRDWARLERLVAAMSVIAMFVIALVANYAAWRIFRGSFPT
jgi:cytochrome c-type biogenesis protein CcmH/NrfG